MVQGGLAEEDERISDEYEFEEARFTRHANVRFFHPVHDGLVQFENQTTEWAIVSRKNEQTVSA